MGTLITSFRQIGTTFDDGTYIDLPTFDVTAKPTVELSTHGIPIQNSGSGPIVVSGGTLTTDGGGGSQPPITVVGPSTFPDITLPEVDPSAVAIVLDSAGNQYVYGAASQTTIESGQFQYVYGVASNTTIDGEQNVYAGGSAFMTTLNAGGVQINWGNANVTTVYGGIQFVWATATDTTISSGQQIVMPDGIASSTEIYPNGEQVVLTGGNASYTYVGGVQSVYGDADNTTIRFGGLQRVHGQVTTTTVGFNSEQNVYADGTATDTTLSNSSVQVDWGTAVNTTVGTGSAQYVWGAATNTTLSWQQLGGSGTQYVEAGGCSYGTSISIDCTQYVYRDGTSNGTTVGLLGNQFVYGNDTGSTVYGTQDIWGVASNATIIGGIQNVRAGGFAQNTTIDSASAHVFAGGAIEDVTFGYRFAGLVLDQGAAFSGSISGWQSFDTIDLGGVAFVEGTITLAYAANSDNSGGTLTMSDGTYAVALALLGQYTAADFAISSDGHGGTSIYNPVLPPDITLTPPLAA